MKAVIFGASGQDGFYLLQLLERKSIETTAVARSGNGLIGDVSDWQFVERVIKHHQPDYVFHLAANSTTQHKALFDNHAAISTGTINILEAVYRHSRQSRVFLSGSAMQFENKGLPIDENTAFAPLSPYAVSRIQSVYAARYYRSLGLKVFVGYFFNHDSPRRTEQHINQKIASAAKRIALGSAEKLEIGSIKVKKEFNYAGDVIEAVWRLVSQDDVYEAVIGSGKAYSIEDWINLCFISVGRNWRDYVKVKTDFKPEYQILVSNPELIKSLNWQPKVDIYDLAEMMIKNTDPLLSKS
jgi:GDPmannose 4,6-dehydratase